MNTLRFLVVALLFSGLMKAEYNGYFLSFEIENEAGEKSTGYGYVAAAYLNLDSIENTTYLKHTLDQRFDNWNDSLHYYQTRFSYNYKPFWSEGEISTIYYMDEPVKMTKASIKKIKVVELIDFTYTIGIANDLSASDTLWMKTEPVKKAVFSGYLVFYQIFVHQNSAVVDAVLAELESKQLEIDSLSFEDEDGYFDYDMGDKIDAELDALVAKLNRQKVVVIVENSD